MECYNSNPILSNVTITENIAIGSGGGIILSNSNPYFSNVTISKNTIEWGNNGGIFLYSSNITFDPENKCNIYLNRSYFPQSLGQDIYAMECSPIDVIVDTFTVLEPTDYYANPLSNFTFDIQNAKIEPVNQDLYVSHGKLC